MSREKKHFAVPSVGSVIDSIVATFNPEAGLQRKIHRHAFSAFDAIDGTRTRKKRRMIGGTGDSQLDSTSRSGLRDASREMMLNNPLVEGILTMERDEVIGSGPKYQAKTSNENWNKEAERLFKEFMIDMPVDNTNRFNFNQLLRLAYLAVRRDGDCGLIYHDDSIQHVEAEQIGSPFGNSGGDLFKIVNGCAYAKHNNRLLGYYVGDPDATGYYIKPDSYKKIPANKMDFMFTPQRSSQSRGKPALTSSIDFIEKLCKYIDAELIAAAINACFSVFITRREVGSHLPGAYTKGISSSGLDDDDNRLEKIEPGTIFYGEPGEDAKGIGSEKPGSVFDPFVNKMLTFIGRPIAMPLMLITLDFSGATFMNARIAYQQAHKVWKAIQSDLVVPTCSHAWRWHIDRMIRLGKLSDIPDKYNHYVQPNRWPYVDPYKEAMAHKIEVEILKSNSRRRICAARGDDFDEVVDEVLAEDDQIRKSQPVEVTKNGK